MAAKREVKYENGSVYSLVSCSDLTPGSLDVWVELPDQIKYDPSLAPFRHKYELHHGKLEPASQEDGDATLHKSLPLVSNTQHVVQSTGENGSKLNVPISGAEDKTVKSMRRKRLDHVLGIIKLSVLVAGWLFLTVSLLMNQETTDVVLHTAVAVGEAKEYPLLSSSKRVNVLVTLTGPFASTTNQSTDKLIVWLSRAENSKFEMNSSFWYINLQPVETIDFSESVTKTKTLELDEDLISEAAEIEELQDNGEGKNASSVHLRMQSTSSKTVPLTLTYQLNAVSQAEGIMYSVGLLLSLYILIIFEVINRTIAALLSSSLGVAVLAAVGQRPSLPELVSWLDVETLLLLFSMMLLVAILADTGLFDYLAVLAYQVTGGRTWPLINCLCLFTAVFSTFLDNVTTVLLMTPVTIRLCEVMQLNPVPVLMSMVIFSNVGGAATPVGDPPNVIIASHPALLKEVNFTSFTLHMGAGTLLVAWQTYAQLRYLYRDVSRLRHSEPTDIQEMRHEILAWRRAAASLSSYSRDEDIVRKALEKKVEKLNLVLRKKESGAETSKSDPKFSATLAQMREKYRIRDKPLLIKSTICVSFVVVVFFLHAFPELQRLSLGWTALLGAMLLLLLAGRELEPALARVEWSTLLFFTALFVLMEALSKLGLISWIGDKTEAVILGVNEKSRLAVALMLILWVSGLASAFVDNIPLTTMMVRVIARLADPTGLALPLPPLAWALSFGACLGGNGTLIGASANVVCAGVAEQHGYRFTFVQFFKIGFPIMIGNLIVSSVYLLVCHCVFTWH